MTWNIIMKKKNMYNNFTKSCENTELVNMDTELLQTKKKKNEELGSIYSCDQCDFSTTELAFFKKHIHKKILLENQQILYSTVILNKYIFFEKYSASMTIIIYYFFYFELCLRKLSPILTNMYLLGKYICYS